jgi:hypothetical protein
MSNATALGQLIGMALRNSSAHKGWPQPALQRLENPSRSSAFWLSKKAVVFEPMSGERIVFSTMHPALPLLPMADRSLSAIYCRRSSQE